MRLGGAETREPPPRMEVRSKADRTIAIAIFQLLLCLQFADNNSENPFYFLLLFFMTRSVGCRTCEGGSETSGQAQGFVILLFYIGGPA